MKLLHFEWVIRSKATENLDTKNVPHEILSS